MSKKNRGRHAPQINIEKAMELAAEKAAALATERSVAQVTRVVEATLPIIERAKEQQGGIASGSQLRRAMNQRVAKTVYGLNDPQRFTVSQDPRYRPFSGVTVEHLRLLARRYDVLAACITHLKSEVVKTPIKVVPLDDKDKSDATKKQIADATKFLGVTGGIGGWGSPREEYEAKLLDDVLVIGAGASWLSYDTLGAMSKGSPDEVIAVDAGTIRPLVTPFGFPPDDDQPRYEQWIQGYVTASFKRTEMIYRGLPIFAQTNSPYYISPVELLISVVFTALKADEWNRTWLTDGNTPDWWMQMPDGMSPDQAVEWLDLFDAMMSGELGMRHKIRMTPGEPKPGNSRKDSDFDIYEHWLMERTCSVMGVNPASIGHHSDTYKDSQEIALKSTSGGRVAQLLMFRNGHYTEILERKGYDKVRVVEDVNDEDAKARADRQKIEVEGGWKTLNEVRQENGDEPYDLKQIKSAADMPFVQGYLTPLLAIEQQMQQGVMPPDGGPGAPPGGGGTGDNPGDNQPDNNGGQNPQNVLKKPDKTSDKTSDKTGDNGAANDDANPKRLGLEWGELLQRGRYSCARLQLDQRNAATVLDFARGLIDPDDLSFDEDGDGGFEDDPHVTVFYGLHTNDPADLAPLLKRNGAVWLRLGKTSVFEGAAGGACDVVKLEVQDNDGELYDLNQKLGLLPNSNTFPEYVPHLTLAYVKPGTGQKYAGLLSPMCNTGLRFETLMFSSSDKQVTYLDLTSGQPVAENRVVTEREPAPLPVVPKDEVTDGAGEILSVERFISFEPLKSALCRYERKAMNRLKDRGTARCKFEDTALPVGVPQAIGAVLERCSNKEAVRWAFDRVAPLVRQIALLDALHGLDPTDLERLQRAEWIEAEHPRDPDGRFGHGGAHEIRTAVKLAPNHGQSREALLQQLNQVANEVETAFAAHSAARTTPGAEVQPSHGGRTDAGGESRGASAPDPGTRLEHEAAVVRSAVIDLHNKRSQMRSTHFERLARVRERMDSIKLLLPDASPDDAEELRREQRELVAHLEVLTNEHQRADNELLTRMRAAVYQPEDALRHAPAITQAESLTPRERQRYDEAMDVLQRLSAGALTPGMSLHLDRAPEGVRSKYASGQRTLYLERGSSARVGVHEGGHAIECQNPAVLWAATSFLERRTLGEEPAPLSDLTGQSYRDDELARADRFADAYMGKDYRNPKTGRIEATEIISMGLELMAQDPGRFAKADPETFDFIHAVLRDPLAVAQHQQQLLDEARAASNN